MAEYIDRAVLLLEIINGIKAGNFEEGYENYAHINDMDDIIETIKYSDTADVIPLEKIKELRSLALRVKHNTGSIDTLIDKLDKLIAERGRKWN